MRRFFVGVAVAGVLALPSAAQAQSRGFIVRLGNDTIAIERFERSADRIEGTILRRIPQTNFLKYSIRLNPDGSVATYEQSVLRADGSPSPLAPTPLKIAFVGDSVMRDVTRNNQPVNLRAAAPKGTLPATGGSWLGNELVIEAAKRGQVHTIGVNAQQAARTLALSLPRGLPRTRRDSPWASPLHAIP